jgi:hypothetical protein
VRQDRDKTAPPNPMSVNDGATTVMLTIETAMVAIVNPATILK